MKIKELIAELQKADQNKDVIVKALCCQTFESGEVEVVIDDYGVNDDGDFELFCVE